MKALYLTLLIFSIQSCEQKPSQEDSQESTKKTVKEYILQNGSKKVDYVNFFIGFRYGMSEKEYNSLKNKLLKEGKLHRTDSGRIGYDVLLKTYKCEGVLNPDFVDGKLVSLNYNFVTPDGVGDYTVQDETLSMLHTNYGTETVIVPLLEAKGVFNDTVHHWFKDGRHIIYMNSSFVHRHLIEFANTYVEAKKIKSDESLEAAIEESKRSNGQSSGNDFK